VVTTTSPVPALPAAVVTVIWVALSTVKPDTVTPAMETAEAFERFVPVISTVVPPTVGPAVGLMELRVGGTT